MRPPRVQISLPPAGGENYRNALRQSGITFQGGYCPVPDLACDGLLLCGGGDLAPALYGQENRGSDPPDPRRDEAELALFHAFCRAGKPILGICRGFQVMNVALGGTLLQHLPPAHLPFHRGRDGEDAVHPIRTAPDGPLFAWYGPLCRVNSSHHQAVGELGGGLQPAAWAEGGFPEAAVHETLPVLGVQFHPERMAWGHRRGDTADGSFLFRWLARQCREAMGGEIGLP